MIDIAILGGGCSPEHDVSLKSAAQVLANLDGSRFRPWPVYLRRDGEWAVPDRPHPAIAGSGVAAFPTEGMNTMHAGRALGQLIDAGVHVAFPVLHGPFGEDGTLQGMFDLHGIRYVGSGCAASATAMDKIRTRQCLLAVGVAMAKAYVGVPVHRADPEEEARCIADSVGFPCFLKTDQSGSSLGVVRADGPEDVTKFLGQARRLGRRFLAEALLAGEEISVPVLGNSGYEVAALPPIGIYPVPGESFFDYGVKYDPMRCEETVPPRGLSEEQIEQVQALAVTCHEAIQCDGLSRVDMIVSSEGPRVLEVNTMPGFTPASLYPKSAAAAGIAYSDLLSRLIDLAMQLPTRKEILA